MANVRLQEIGKRYDDGTEVIRNVSLDIEDGEFMVFVGPSGCGKSTMLRMLAGLEDISRGDLVIGDRRVNDVSPSKRGVSMVFQSYALYPHMSVYENMAFGLKLAGTSRQEADKAVRQAADILKLTPLLDRRPKALSGGQRQRVAIGRAIVRKPGVFLFDEPLSNLDAALRVQMRIELARLHSQLKATMVYVTHDQVEAMTLGDRIAVFNGGVIEQVGAPLELYNRPANKFVATFLGSPSMNILPCDFVSDAGRRYKAVIGGKTSVAIAENSHGLPTSGGAIGIRPEHVVVDGSASEGAGGGVSARIRLIEHLGEVAIAYVEISGHADPIAVKLSADSTAFQIGQTVNLRFPEQHVFVFDAGGKALY
ncbi:sugar ABC transporter ATP-binding protein [Burkholderia sp. Nafp2/4-1b]|uniref:ABC transporter ATP-binding protein n=1 Tax=Burkholderia sp. Nafp2/4-1b TaxID=2116686 RepID=UPI000EF88BF6|nr:sn-glycerol-3-phosphate ABC transporter ATP-binding protein UgpC [Burkholderia sp. Nafp2/4-1b]RKU00070.1 sugar ABC transporter ATP-binding protein [Burkholderia sp. Nafp2/4-1b]